jgi:hypothetical protein
MVGMGAVAVDRGVELRGDKNKTTSFGYASRYRARGRHEFYFSFLCICSRVVVVNDIGAASTYLERFGIPREQPYAIAYYRNELGVVSGKSLTWWQNFNQRAEAFQCCIILF